jgi:hypothetical protein
MKSLQFDVSMDDLPGFRADAVLGDSVFQVLVDPRDLRRLRSSLMEMARIAGEGRHSILILDEPQIGHIRLFEEWSGIQRLFRPQILERLTIVVRNEGNPEEVIGDLSHEEKEAVETVAEHARQHALRPMRRPSEAFFDILRVILIHWIRKSGPLTSKELKEQSGFSYPTIASALEKLDPYLIRHSDRRVELQSFPKDAWFKLLAQVEKVRCSQSFTDRSGSPRTPEKLLERLREEGLRRLGRDQIAVGGIFGARHYLPGIDLIGNPRLDLVIDAGTRRLDRPARPVDFGTILRKLDPALKPAERGEPCQVVVHTLYRAKSFFTESEDGLFYADEVECLLDLHETHLEAQAMEFLEKLSPRKKP